MNETFGTSTKLRDQKCVLNLESILLAMLNSNLLERLLFTLDTTHSCALFGHPSHESWFKQNTSAI